MRKTEVFCRLSFEGFHRWKDAKPPVEYLANLHRHMFHVVAWKHVDHPDRDIEFITLKLKIEEHCNEMSTSPGVEQWSCEHWAAHLLVQFGLSRCEVSEDGENGAIVYAE